MRIYFRCGVIRVGRSDDGYEFIGPNHARKWAVFTYLHYPFDKPTLPNHLKKLFKKL